MDVSHKGWERHEITGKVEGIDNGIVRTCYLFQIMANIHAYRLMINTNRNEHLNFPSLNILHY